MAPAPLVPGRAGLVHRVGALEGVELHAFLVDAHGARHARGVALEVVGGADHLAREADVGERRLVAVAIAPGAPATCSSLPRLSSALFPDNSLSWERRADGHPPPR